MGHMAAGLAHELNQPLAAIVNFAAAARHMIKNGVTDLKQVESVLTDIVGETSRAGEIIRRMRSFVRKASLQTQPVDAGMLVNEALKILAFDLRQANIQPAVHVAPRLPLVMADTVQITQVFVNLVRNAIDSMYELPAAQRHLTVSVERASPGAIAFNVFDTGRGVNPADIPRLFDAFYTTKTQGLGIGLALCRIIIEEHGGHITARANSPRGMHFCFTLKPADNRREDGQHARAKRADRIRR